MNAVPRPLLPLLLVAGLLTACGGGVTIGFFDDGDDFVPDAPVSSGRPASVTVSAATDATLDGVYAAANARIGSVVGFFGDPDTCRFRFEGLQQANSGRVMSGEIRYLVNSNTVLTTIVVIDTREFRVDGGSAATVDRANNAIAYSGAVLANTQGLGQSLTLSGSIPMQNEAKPSRC